MYLICSETYSPFSPQETEYFLLVKQVNRGLSFCSIEEHFVKLTLMILEIGVLYLFDLVQLIDAILERAHSINAKTDVI